MSTHHSFDEAEVRSLLAAAERQRSTAASLLQAPSDTIELGGRMTIGETCLSIEVENHQVCLHIPIVNRDVCLPIPDFIPDGTVAEACLKICTTWGIPTGACVTVKALGRQVVQQCFGAC